MCHPLISLLFSLSPSLSLSLSLLFTLSHCLFPRGQKNRQGKIFMASSCSSFPSIEMSLPLSRSLYRSRLSGDSNIPLGLNEEREWIYAGKTRHDVFYFPACMRAFSWRNTFLAWKKTWYTNVLQWPYFPAGEIYVLHQSRTSKGSLRSPCLSFVSSNCESQSLLEFLGYKNNSTLTLSPIPGKLFFH